MDASKLRERREQRLGYKVASPRASNPRTDKTSEDRLDHVKRERESARGIGGSTRRGRKKIEKKPPRPEVLIFNSENQRNVFLPEGLGLFPT